MGSLINFSLQNKNCARDNRSIKISEAEIIVTRYVLKMISNNFEKQEDERKAQDFRIMRMKNIAGLRIDELLHG